MDDKHLKTISDLGGEVHPIAEMPRTPRGKYSRLNSNVGSLSGALRELEPEIAVFIPRHDDETLQDAQHRLRSTASYVGELNTRQDIEKDGIWLFRKESKPE
jgi:hypothetical protein